MVNLAQSRPSVRQYPEKQLRQLREFCAKRHWDILRESEDRARNRHVKSAFSDLWSFRGITFHTPKLGITRVDLLLWNSVFVSAINELSSHKRKRSNSFESRDAPLFDQPSPQSCSLPPYAPILTGRNCLTDDCGSAQMPLPVDGSASSLR